MNGSLFLADAWILWILVPLYLGWVALWWLATRPRSGPGASTAAIRFSSLGSLARLGSSRSLRVRRLVQTLRLAVLALVVLAMARPQTGRTLTSVTTEGVDIVLVLDTSGSMEALDLDADRPIQERRHRLAVAKAVVEEFVRGREHDRMGLVVFGEEAFTQCPLTLDHDILATLLERVEIGITGDGRATAIGSALGTAVKRLKSSPARSRVIILLTDGRNNAGVLTPAKAAEIARTFGIKVYTVGVGTRGEAPFLVETLLGRRVIHRPVEIDEETLEEIAGITGGAYFRAEDAAALEEIYARIDELETSEISIDSYLEVSEEFRWLVLPAVGLLLLEVGLLGSRYRRLP